MLKKIKDKKKVMYIIIGVVLVLSIVAWVFIIRKSIRDKQTEIEVEVERGTESGDEQTGPLGDVEAMLKVGEQQKEIEEKYPWYYDLPIENGNYVILWDWERGNFRIALKIGRETDQGARDRIIQEAITDIEELTDLDIKEEDYYIMFIE